MLDREDLSALVKMWLLWGAVILVAVLIFSAKAHAEDEQQIRRDCRRDAVRYCTVEAARCAVAETPECRSAMIACMVGHKDKLRPRCAAHIY